MQTDDADDYVIAPIGVTLDKIEHVRRGSQHYVVACTFQIGDVEIRVNGISIIRTQDGQWAARSPMFRAPDGEWKHAVGVHRSVWNAVVELASEQMIDQRDPRNSPAGRGSSVKP